MMKKRPGNYNCFVGNRIGNFFRVVFRGHELDPRKDVLDYGVEGFEWGSAGPGSRQLALAISCFILGDKLGKVYHADFCWIAIAPRNEDMWILPVAAARRLMTDAIRKYNRKIKLHPEAIMRLNQNGVLGEKE